MIEQKIINPLHATGANMHQITMLTENYVNERVKLCLTGEGRKILLQVTAHIELAPPSYIKPNIASYQRYILGGSSFLD